MADVGPYRRHELPEYFLIPNQSLEQAIPESRSRLLYGPSSFGSGALHGLAGLGKRYLVRLIFQILLNRLPSHVQIPPLLGPMSPCIDILTR